MHTFSLDIRFLGPRMIYTSGVIMDINRKESLEELQDNKLTLVCNKLDLKPEDKYLDIGCGWGTLATFAAKNFGCDSTGITLSKHQTAFGNQRLKDNGITPDRGRILCVDYRDIPGGPGTFTKISSLEMAEVRLEPDDFHISILLILLFRSMSASGVMAHSSSKSMISLMTRVFSSCKFLASVNVGNTKISSGLSSIIYSSHYVSMLTIHALLRGLFMNKYVFPGADASCSVSWVVNQCEKAGFEVRCVDVLGVHYSATIHRWYENWVSNKDKVIAAYGERWYRIWVFFLAWSVIISR